MVTRRDVLKTIGASSVIPAISIANTEAVEIPIVSEQKSRTILEEPPRIMYKVVRKDDDKYYSSNMKKFPVEYKINEWVYPNIPGSKLFIFKDKEEALQYHSMRDQYSSVFECEVGPYELCEKIISSDTISAWALIDDIENFWNNRAFNNTHSLYLKIRKIHLEAYLTNKIKLLKQIS